MKLSRRTCIAIAAAAVVAIIAIIVLKKKSSYVSPRPTHATLDTMNNQPMFEVTKCKSCSLYPYVGSKECDDCMAKGMLNYGVKDQVDWNTGFPYATYVGSSRKHVESYVHEYTGEDARCGSGYFLTPRRI